MARDAAKFVIERWTTPHFSCRYLVVLDDGNFGWGEPGLPIMVFDSRHKAESFRLFRLGAHAADAVVTCHAVN